MSRGIVFQVNSNFDGSQVALSRLKKYGGNNHELFLGDNALKLKKFQFTKDFTFDGQFKFEKDSSRVFYDGIYDQSEGIWVDDLLNPSPKEFFKFDGIGYFFPLAHEEIVFIGKSLVLDKYNGYDWFSYSPKKGINKLTDKRYYFYPPPFIISDAIVGFDGKGSAAKRNEGDSEHYLEYVILDKKIFLKKNYQE